MLFLLFAGLISGCGKLGDDHAAKNGAVIQDGIYMGYFEYQNQKYWSEIAFDGNTYVEWPSGGAMFQKPYGCLTVGTFEVSGYKLIFKLGAYKMKEFPGECVNDMSLPDVYTIYGTMKKDSIVFEKGSGSAKIKYHLLKLKLN